MTAPYDWAEVKPLGNAPRLNPTLVLDHTPQQLADQLDGLRISGGIVLDKRTDAPHPATISAAIARNVAENTRDGAPAWHMVAAAHEKTIRLLAAELAVLKGLGQTPQRGAQHTVMTLDAADVLVEYESFDGTVSILNVFINGAWCDADSAVPAAVIEGWVEKLAEAEPEQIPAGEARDSDFGAFLGAL